MSKRIWIVLSVLVVLNVALIVARVRSQSKQAAKVEAREAQDLSRGLRAAPRLLSNDPYFLIGDLVISPHWTGVLPLSKEQADAIMRLDGLVREARDQSLNVDADYLAGSPKDFRAYAARQEARRSKAIGRAQRMVASGLLSQPQADLLIQHYLSTKRPVHTLSNENVQEMLGMTEEQKFKLAHIKKLMDSQQSMLNLFSTDPDVQKDNTAIIAANDQDADAETLKILGPEQQETWSRLTSKRLPVAPPDLSSVAASDPAAAKARVEELSPTFRALSEKSKDLGLSDEEKRLLGTLETIVHTGLQWIDKVPGDRAPERRAEFVKSAEQFARLGILTERQAKQLEEAVPR